MAVVVEVSRVWAVMRVVVEVTMVEGEEEETVATVVL